MRIAAPAGMGKDAVIRYFQRKYSPSRTRSDLYCPILHVTLRSERTPKKILTHWLDQLQCAYAERQDIETYERYLFEATKACGTVAVFINEAQHLFPVSRQRTRARIAGAGGDWIKRLFDTWNVSYFFFGVPGWDELFDEDDQLGTRIPFRYEFGRFELDRIFIGALAALDTAIPMPEPAGLAQEELARPLFQASKGNWRRLMYLLHDALVTAASRGSPKIELRDLWSAYRLKFGLFDNPFTGRPSA